MTGGYLGEWLLIMVLWLFGVDSSPPLSWLDGSMPFNLRWKFGALLTGMLQRWLPCRVPIFLILLVLDIRPATCNEEYHQKHGRLNIAKLSGVIDFDSATGVVRAAWSIQLNISFLMFSSLFSFSACHLITLDNHIQDQWDEWFNHQPTKYRNKSRHFFSLCNTIASIKLEPSTPLNSGAGLCQLSFRKSGAFSRASDNDLQVIYAIYGCFLGGPKVAYPPQ